MRDYIILQDHNGTPEYGTVYSRIAKTHANLSNSKSDLSSSSSSSSLFSFRFKSVHCLLYPDTPWCPTQVAY